MQAAAEPTGGRRLNEAWFVFILGFSVLAAQNATLILPPLLVDIASDLEVSVPVAAQLGTATFAAWAVSVVVGAPLSDSFGRRPMALAGMLVLTVSVIASAFAPNLEVLAVLRAMTGLGGGMIPPNNMGAIVDTIGPERRAKAMGIVMASNVVSMGVSVPLVTLLADWQDWRFAFLVSGLLLGVSFLTIWIWFPNIRRAGPRSFEFFSRFRALLSLRFFQVAVLVHMVQRMAFWGFISYFAAYLIKTYDVSVGFLAVPLAITAVAQVAGSYLAPHLANLRNYALLVASTSMAGGVCGMFYFATDIGLWPAVALATAATGLLTMTFPVLVAISTRFSGNSTATGVGLMGVSNQGGGALGTALAGALLANYGFAGIGYMCLGLTVACVLGTLLFRRE